MSIETTIQNLQSKNEGIVLKAIDECRIKGNEKVLPALLDLLISTKNKEVADAIKSILFELKERGIVDSYEDENTEEMFFLTDEGKKFMKNTNPDEETGDEGKILKDLF